jgi:hypothetical protein
MGITQNWDMVAADRRLLALCLIKSIITTRKNTKVRDTPYFGSKFNRYYTKLGHGRAFCLYVRNQHIGLN